MKKLVIVFLFLGTSVSLSAKANSKDLELNKTAKTFIEKSCAEKAFDAYNRALENGESEQYASGYADGIFDGCSSGDDTIVIKGS